MKYILHLYLHTNIFQATIPFHYCSCNRCIPCSVIQYIIFQITKLPSFKEVYLLLTLSTHVFTHYYIATIRRATYLVITAYTPSLAVVTTAS